MAQVKKKAKATKAPTAAPAKPAPKRQSAGKALDVLIPMMGALTESIAALAAKVMSAPVATAPVPSAPTPASVPPSVQEPTAPTSTAVGLADLYNAAQGAAATVRVRNVTANGRKSGAAKAGGRATRRALAAGRARAEVISVTSGPFAGSFQLALPLITREQWSALDAALKGVGKYVSENGKRTKGGRAVAWSSAAQCWYTYDIQRVPLLHGIADTFNRSGIAATLKQLKRAA